MAAAATDTLAVGTTASDSIVMTMTTTAVVVEATETQPAAPGTGRTLSYCPAWEGQRVAGSLGRCRAGRRAWAQIHLQLPAARSRVVMGAAEGSLRRCALTPKMMSTSPCL